jgi:hypothetical protein
MIGKKWWILIWYGILALGVVGLVMAVNWGRHVKWKNLEEILRGIGTIAVSVGMLLLLHGAGGGAGQTLLLAALLAFVLAFAVGREEEPAAAPPSETPTDPDAQ